MPRNHQVRILDEDTGEITLVELTDSPLLRFTTGFLSACEPAGIPNDEALALNYYFLSCGDKQYIGAKRVPPLFAPGLKSLIAKGWMKKSGNRLYCEFRKEVQDCLDAAAAAVRFGEPPDTGGVI